MVSIHFYGFEDEKTEFLFYLNTEDMSFINRDASYDGTLAIYYPDGMVLELFTDIYNLTSLQEGVTIKTRKISNGGTYTELNWTNPNIVLVTNERNESIKLHFTGDRLTKIENTDFSRKTEFNYITANGKYYLSYVSEYLCDELGDRLVRKDSFDYFTPSMYLKDYESSVNTNRVFYSYENQKLKKIIIDNGLSSSMEYTYFPNENYTKLVNQYNEEFFVYYNDSQQKVMTLSGDGYVSYESQSNYNGVYIKQRKAVLSSDLNLIENIDLSTWEGYSPSEDSKNENGIFPDAMGDYIFKRKGYKEQPRLIKTTITPSVIYEGEQWFFSVWGKQKFSLSSIFQVIVTLNDQNGVIKDYTFNFNKTDSNWQLLSGYIIADVEYKSITLAIKNQGDEEVYIGKTTLYKNSQSSEYGYNNKGQIEDLSFGSNHVEFTYDNGKIKTASTPSGRLINYMYNNDGYLESIEDDCSLYSIQNTYNNKNLVKQVISSIDGKIIEKSYIYNARGEVTKTVDENGLITDYLYDNFGRLLEIQDSSGIVYNNKYNTRGKIIRSKNHLNDSCDGGVFTYGTNKELYSVETENKAKYGFSYNQDRLINGVSINDSSIISESFEKLINNQKTDLTTEKKYRVNPDHHFQFNYDDKSRLISKKNNQNDIVSIVYDDVNNNMTIEDHVNHNTKTTKFNDNGTLREKAINIGNTRFSNYQYRYDNLNGLQKKNYFEYSSSYLRRSYDFDQGYEFQEYSLEGYLDRISIPFLNDYFRPNKIGKSLYSDVPSLKLFAIDYDENLKQSIMKFVDNASCLSFNKNDINANRIHMKKYGNNIYDQTVWKSNFSVNKLMYSWMRLSGQTDLNKEIMRFGDLSLYVNSNKVLILQHGTSHITTGLSVFLNEWSLVGLRLAGTEATVFINGDSSTHVISYNSSNVDYLTIGKHPATNHQSYLDEITPSLASCVMDILYIGLGTHHTTTDHLSRMYFEGKNYLDVEFKNTKEQVSYYNHYLYKDAEVISLNGSFTTSKSNEPTSYFYTNKDFKLDKTRLFEYDHDLQRHVYGSYRNYYNYDTSKKSKLVYQLGFASVGSVNLFVKPSIAFVYSKRTILNFKNGTDSVFDIFMDEQNELKILVNGIPYSTNGLKLTINEWQMLTVLWQTNQIQISVNNSEILAINTTTFNLENTTLYIGSSHTNDIPDNHFEGTIQMLSIWHSNLSTQAIGNLFDDGLAMIYQTEFDVNGRLKSKNLIDGVQVLSKKYQYYDEVYDDNGEQKQKLNSLPTSEIDIDGIETVYIYDEYSNVLSKEKISDSGVPFLITRYEYDVLKRLSKESVSTVAIDDSDPNSPIRSEGLLYAHLYTYDSNGNITEKKKLDPNNLVDYVDTYHYSTSFKDRLENISRNDHGVITTVYGMTYSSDEPFRPSTITENGQSKNLVWHGPKLMQYGDYEYAYNEIGLRIKKTAPGLNVAYDVDDLMVIRSIDKIYDRIIDYHFDQHEQVIGFSYQGKEFLYQRDILGEIYGIIDKNGKRFVTYTYTAYGVPTIEIPSNLTTTELSLAQAIRDLNIYLYKGYVYDQETGLYYCHTRYYNPNIGRWISIDDVSYLDPGTIGGMNLYTYCGNNPVMYFDNHGCAPQWFGWFLTGVMLTGLTALTLLTLGAAAPITGLASTMIIGATIGGYIGVGVSVISQGHNDDWHNIDSFQVFRDGLGGAVAGAISAIPTGSGAKGYFYAFGLGGTGSLSGGIISGNVTSWQTGLLAFGMGGVASVIAKSVSNLIISKKANRIFNQGRKAKSLFVQELQGHPLNMGSVALKGSMRNAFKDTSLTTIKGLIEMASPYFRLGIYSSLVSASFSTIPYIFID